MASNDDERKRQHEFRMGRVQYVVTVLAVVHVMAFLVGAALGFIYLVRHQFNPGGISGSDTLAMILWALGFLLSLIIGLVFATVAAFPLARIIDAIHTISCRFLLWLKGNERFPKPGFWWHLTFGTPNKLEWRRDQKTFLFFGSVALAIFLLLVIIAPFELKMFFLAILTPGLFISLTIFGEMKESFSPVPRPVHRSSIDRIMSRLSIAHRGIAISIVLVLSTTFLYIGKWLDASAVLIGFREQNVIVRLSKEDFSEILEQATRSGLAVNPCEQLSPEVTTLQNVDILWQNLGTKSLLRFPSQPLWDTTVHPDEIRLETGNGSIANVVRPNFQRRCGEILSDVLFRHGTNLLKASAGANVLHRLPWLENLAAGSKIQIVAHNVKSTTSGADNVTETLQQALAVKRVVAGLAKLSSSAIEVVGAGGEKPKQECEKRSGVQHLLCEASNRRIEIRLLDSD